MSLPSKQKGTCPKCSAALEFTVWNSINTNLAPDITDQIISGDFFKHTCPHCGLSINLEYSTLYHDIKNKVVIWVIRKNEEYSSRVDDAQKGSVLFTGYTGRIVHSISELREKVSIIESGRDDRVIEIFKLMSFAHLTKEFPDFNATRQFYISSEHGEYIEFYDKDDNTRYCPLEEDFYRKISSFLSPLLTSSPTCHLDVIDRIWAENALEQLEDKLNSFDNIDPVSAEQPTAPDTNTSSSVVFCRMCGEKLFSDSKFCHKCGTQIVTAPTSVPQSPPQTSPTPVTSHTTTSPAPHPMEPTNKKPNRIKPFVIGLAIAGCVLFTSQPYWKAAFLYDISFKEGPEIIVQVGDSHTISYTAELGNQSPSEITWYSSDTSIATVSSDGVVTGKSEGQVTVSASINGITKESCSVDVTLKIVPVKNGEMIKRPRRTDYPEVTVNAPANESCFVYFKNLKNSAYDFAFYVKAGSSATVNAPTGTYILYYASGKNWYGPELKFGQGSHFYKSPDPITLEEDETSYDVLELTLYEVVDGNMDTDPIDESEFPM